MRLVSSWRGPRKELSTLAFFSYALELSRLPVAVVMGVLMTWAVERSRWELEAVGSTAIVLLFGVDGQQRLISRPTGSSASTKSRFPGTASSAHIFIINQPAAFYSFYYNLIFIFLRAPASVRVLGQISALSPQWQQDPGKPLYMSVMKIYGFLAKNPK
jgi:hypothetical protein